MNIAIIGYGLQGQSVYEHYKGSDNQITVCDKNVIKNLPGDVEHVFGDNYLNDLSRFDLIFRSPSVHPNDIAAINGPEIVSKVTTNTNEFLKLCPSTHVIGITGTKGKGTTSTLIAKMLEAEEFKVHLGGNIGTPPLDLLSEDIKTDDWVVLELASDQLIDIDSSPPIAICLMVEPEHLDWHQDIDEYFEAKARLFHLQKPEDVAIYYAENAESKRIASASPGTLLPYYASPGAEVIDGQINIDGEPIVRVSELKLAGKHNWQNVCAAVTAVWQIKKDTEAMASVLREFSGLPFRIELRREVNGVKYYDDSFASAPAATIAAIEAVKGQKILILGGHDRGLDLSDLVSALNEYSKDIKKVLIIGESSKRLAAELNKSAFDNFEIIEMPSSMEDIVIKASKIASDGDSVILSPAFPSFDMFKNFEDRGVQFNEAVRSL